jgi:hypothetical protein
MNDRVARASAIVVVLIASGVLAIDISRAQDASPIEEVVGPFPSWRQLTCTGNDDTAMLQSALDALGQPGQSPVLYINPGTCRITSTLRLGQDRDRGRGGVQNVTLLGHHPADTRILWAGRGGDAMIEVNGVGHSRFGRLTWDGAGRAGIGYIDRTDKSQPYFPTGVRHEDEWFTGIGGVAFYLGAYNTGTSEWEYMRLRLSGPMQAGIFLANANTLDHWLWDSLCENVDNCIGNFIEKRQANGAGGDIGVNRSVFVNNGNDIVFGNAQPFGSSRWNYSRGSKAHLAGVGVGRVNTGFTVQGATIIDPAANTPIANLNNGPMGILDTTIRGGKSEGQIGASEAYCSANCLGDVWAIGNTFSNTSVNQYFVPWPSAGRLHGRIDDRLGQGIDDPGAPALPSVPPWSSAPVIEVQNGDVAAALAQAGNQRAVVHIPYGQWDVPGTLEVGPNVTLTGDGFGATQLRAAGETVTPIIHIGGPSHAVVRDLSLRGWTLNGRVTDGLVIDNADQPGGLVHAENSFLQSNHAGWDVRDLQNTVVDLFDDNNGGNTHCGYDGPGPDVDYRVVNGRLHIFNGAGAGSDAMFDLKGAEVLDETHYFEGNPGCQPATLITPNGSGTFVINEGNYAPTVGGIDLSTFTGSVTLANFANTLALDSPKVVGRNFGPNTLVMGLAYGNKVDANAPTFVAPYVYWLGQHVQPNEPMLESASGVDDTAQFMRDHLALLRSTRPLDLNPRPPDVTDVRLYRVGGERLVNALAVRGTNGQVSARARPPAAAQPRAQAAEQSAIPSAPAVLEAGGWIVPPVVSVSADRTWEKSAHPTTLFTCKSQGWNAGDYTVALGATFTGPMRVSGVRISALASPEADQRYTFRGHDGQQWVNLGTIQAHVPGRWAEFELLFPEASYSRLEIVGSNGASWLALRQVWVRAASGTADPCSAG